MTDDDDPFDREKKDHLTAEQRLASINTKAGNLVDKMEEVVDWEPKDWEPPEEGPKSNTHTFELTVSEMKALKRTCRREAGKRFDKRGDNPTYRKYKYLAEKFGSFEIEYHKQDGNS